MEETRNIIDIGQLSDTVSTVKTLERKDTGKLSDLITNIHRHFLYGVAPALEIYSWKTTETSPSGQRHIPSGIPFESPVSSLGYLSFGDINSLTKLGTTKCITFKVARQLGQMSITNMRIWKSAAAGLGTYGGAGNFSVNMLVSGAWTQNYTLPSGTGSILSETLPAAQNISRWDGNAHMTCGMTNQFVVADSDKETSQYVYLSLNLDKTFSNGPYGVGGTGSLTLRTTYDYYIGAP